MTTNTPTVRHGFTLLPDTNLFELSRQLEEVLAPVQRQLQVADIALQATRILDTADLNHEPRPSTVIFEAFQAHNEHVNQIVTGEHSCPLTTTVATVFEGARGEALYLVVDANFDQQIEALVDAGLGDYTPYWDEEAHGSRPVGITTAEWAARRRAWTGALRPIDGEPAATAITLGIGDPFADIDLVSDADAVLAAVPHLQERVNLVLNSMGQGMFSTPGEMAAFMNSMPERIEHVTSHLHPITLEDLNGVKAA